MYRSIKLIDCTIIASNSLHCEQSTVEGTKVDVYYIQRENEEQSKEISKYSREILNIFKTFGEIKSKRLSVFIAPRDNGGGYCRPGVIVLTPNDKKQDEIGYFKYIAHELAHLWWLKANVSTWEDWLNESFAEYSALLALREVFGEEAFSKLITQYQSKSKGLPAIKGIERSDSKAWEVLYIKGPLVLYNLEKAKCENVKTSSYRQEKPIGISNNIKRQEAILMEKQRIHLICESGLSFYQLLAERFQKKKFFDGPVPFFQSSEGIYILYGEKYYYRNKSRVLATIIINGLSENKCIIDIIVGGGSQGITATLGSETSFLKKITKFIEALCEEKQWVMTVVKEKKPIKNKSGENNDPDDGMKKISPL